MITTTVKEALGIEEYTLHFLYIIKDEDTVFYIGQSLDPINRLREHLGMSWRNSGSATGQLIKDNSPESDSWQVELLTLKDCEPFIIEHVLPRLSVLGYTLERYHDFGQLRGSMDFAEQALIDHYHPCLNGTHNQSPSHLPERYQKPPTISSSMFLDI